MTNVSGLSTIINDLFSVIGTLISNIVDLMTGDLLVLAIVGAFVAMIVGLIYALLNYVRKQVSGNIKMK